MPGLKRWIQRCRGINSPLVSVIHAPLEINTLFGVMLMAHHLRVDANEIEAAHWLFMLRGCVAVTVLLKVVLIV